MVKRHLRSDHRIQNWLSTWMSDAGWVFGAYGTMPNQWNLNAEGKLEYGSVNPGAKQALATLADWMKKDIFQKKLGYMMKPKQRKSLQQVKQGLLWGLTGCRHGRSKM